MLFRVNTIERSDVIPKTPYGLNNIGLFADCKWEGRGNFCGWYGAEYYLNTKLYAYYISDTNSCIRKKCEGEVMICDPPINFVEIMIGSCYWEWFIEADTIEEAIEKFRNGEWVRKGERK